MALGVTPEGEREVLGLWIANNEGAKFWLTIMNNLKNRGLEGILIAVVDGLKGFRPMLFDLKADPDEFVDLAKSDDNSAEIDRLFGYLAIWGRRMSQRVTRSDAEIIQSRGKSMRKGILPFLNDGSEVPESLTVKYRGAVPRGAND